MTIKKLNVVYVLALISFILFKGKLGSEEFDKVTLFIGAVVFTAVFADAKITAMKYTNPQVICNNKSWSHCGLVIPLGNYFIITLGDIGFFGITASEGCLIVHSSTVRFLGAQIAVDAEVRERPIRSFTPKERESIETMGLNGPYYFGLVSWETRQVLAKQGVDMDKAMTLVEKQNELASELVDILNDKTQAIDKVISQSARTSGAFNPDKGLYYHLIKQLDRFKH